VHHPPVVLRGLRFGYGRETIFDGFDWEVRSAETWSVIGPSGCGKSTLLYLLAGLRQPTAGKLLVGGTPAPRPRASTGLILQNHGLLPWATVWENAALGVRMGHFYKHKRSRPDEPRPYPPRLPLSVVDEWLERLGIGHLRDRYPAQISGGQLQRVAIARTLALQPDLLLMDEPFSALDATTREGLQELVLELQRELGVTTIIVTHNIEEASFLGQRILVLDAPPNRLAAIVENPDAGAPDYRNSAGFLQTTQHLRERLRHSISEMGV
jgi:ABC-type nitrate/sulfonate/bicarbonate transport system ATPase subunit